MYRISQHWYKSHKMLVYELSGFLYLPRLIVVAYNTLTTTNRVCRKHVCRDQLWSPVAHSSSTTPHPNTYTVAAPTPIRWIHHGCVNSNYTHPLWLVVFRQMQTLWLCRQAPATSCGGWVSNPKPPSLMVGSTSPNHLAWWLDLTSHKGCAAWREGGN